MCVNSVQRVTINVTYQLSSATNRRSLHTFSQPINHFERGNSMETLLSSPRSSSGYGSSEEDHACYGLATTHSSSSAPQTPDSLSPLSSDLCGSDINVDLQSVFEDDDIMPDFSDLGVLSDGNELYYLADDWSTVTTPFTENSPDDGTSSLCDLTPEDIDNVTRATTEASSEGNILVSLLKRKSEFDWFPAAADSSDCSQTQLQCTADAVTTSGTSQASQSTVTRGPETVQSSPLQRLKALTHGNIVNNTELPGRTRIIINTSNTPAVVRQQTTAPSSAASSTGPSHTVLRVGVAGSSQLAAASRPSRTSSVLGSSTSQGTSTVKADAPVSRSPVFAVASGNTELTANISSVSAELRPRKSPTLTMTVSAAGAKSAPISIRRPRSELDDHRYSSLLPVPMSFSAAARRPASSTQGGAAKRPNRSLSTHGSGAPSGVGRSTNVRKAGSSMLETLLLTNKTLRPNEGSEASLAACGVWSLRRSNSADSSDPSSNGPRPKRSCSEGTGSLLEHLLTGRTDEPMNGVRVAAVVPKTEPVDVVEEVVEEKLAVDNFSLFSEHLLCDDPPGMNLGGLFGEDASSTWTPACFDDRVSVITCFFISMFRPAC